MAEILIENLVQVVSAVLLAIIGVLGTWVTAKLEKRQELANIQLALAELVGAVNCTAAQLQQVTVDGLKEAAADGKLSEEDVKILGIRLYDGVLRKLSPAAMGVLRAAGLDLAELVRGFGEKAVREMKFQA